MRRQVSYDSSGRPYVGSRTVPMSAWVDQLMPCKGDSSGGVQDGAVDGADDGDELDAEDVEEDDNDDEASESAGNGLEGQSFEKEFEQANVVKLCNCYRYRQTDASICSHVAVAVAMSLE